MAHRTPAASPLPFLPAHRRWGAALPPHRPFRDASVSPTSQHMHPCLGPSPLALLGTDSFSRFRRGAQPQMGLCGPQGGEETSSGLVALHPCLGFIALTLFMPVYTMCACLYSWSRPVSRAAWRLWVSGDASAVVARS